MPGGADSLTFEQTVAALHGTFVGELVQVAFFAGPRLTGLVLGTLAFAEQPRNVSVPGSWSEGALAFAIGNAHLAGGVFVLTPDDFGGAEWRAVDGDHRMLVVKIGDGKGSISVSPVVEAGS